MISKALREGKRSWREGISSSEGDEMFPKEVP